MDGDWRGGGTGEEGRAGATVTCVSRTATPSGWECGGDQRRRGWSQAAAPQTRGAWWGATAPLSPETQQGPSQAGEEEVARGWGPAGS